MREAVPELAIVVEVEELFLHCAKAFLRSSLFTSVIAFGVAVFAFGVGVVALLVGWALVRLSSPVVVAGVPAAQATTADAV